MGRQGRRTHKKGGGGPLWAVLPTDVALLVLQHLSARDKKALALACRTGQSWVQMGRTTFRVAVSSMKDLQAACDQLCDQARTLRIIHTAADATPPLLLLQARRLTLPLVGELSLEDISATAHALAYLARLPCLTSLRLGTSCSSLRLNGAGELRGLAGCAALRSLTVVNIAGDRGMEALTQLTSLHMTLPDHTPNLDALPAHVLDRYVCENCGQLHEEDASELAYAHTDWADKVCVGPALSQLSGLRSLAVDIQGENEQINCRLNKLDLGPGPGLTSLTSLTLLNCALPSGSPLLQHFDALPALRRMEALFEGYSYYMPMHLNGTDKAGRAVTARPLAGRRWELVRELPVVEE